MKKLEYTLIKRDELNLIRALWEKLNIYHKNQSKDFKKYFTELSFDERMKKMLTDKNLELRIEIVKNIHTENIVGYCLTSVANKTEGAIDSIYIESDYRGLSIGDQLMQGALSWLKEKNVKSESIAVACGNEKVLKFYGKYGFKPKLTILKR